MALGLMREATPQLSRDLSQHACTGRQRAMHLASHGMACDCRSGPSALGSAQRLRNGRRGVCVRLSGRRAPLRCGRVHHQEISGDTARHLCSTSRLQRAARSRTGGRTRALTVSPRYRANPGVWLQWVTVPCRVIDRCRVDCRVTRDRVATPLEFLHTPHLSTCSPVPRAHIQ